MNPFDCMAWGISKLLYILKKILLAIVLILIIFLIVKFNFIFNFIDSLNLSYYIKKFDLMQIFSGIRTGVITFWAMIYIDNLNKNRIYNSKLIEEKFDLEQQTVKLLDRFFDCINRLQSVANGGITVNNKEDFEGFIAEFEKISFDLFEITEKTEKFYPFYKIDVYTQKLYRYKYLSKGADKLLQKIKNKEIEIQLKSNTNQVLFADIEDYICKYWVENFNKLLKETHKEILYLQRNCRKL